VEEGTMQRFTRRIGLALVSVGLLAMPAGSAGGATAQSRTPRGTCGPAWEIVLSPNPGSDGNSLVSVVSLSATDAWAAGSYNTRNPTLQTWPLFLHWDGSSWENVPNGTSSPSHFIEAISAITADDIWAVGLGGYVEHWDGLAWSEVPAPALAGSNLWGVASMDTDDVWAVGEYHPNGETAQTFIARWDGSTWSQVPSPNSGTSDNYLYDIAALDGTDIWAVGTSVGPAGYSKALVEHWDGVEWSVVAAPSPRGVHLTPQGVDANGSGSPLFVGWRDKGAGIAKTLLEQWDGAHWRPVRTPNVAGMSNLLYDVTLGMGGVGWAVGGAEIPFTGTYQTLIERSAGGVWTIEDSPDVPGGSNRLLGTTVGSDGDVWAVGTYTPNGQPSRTLVERLCP
jgi:hypothetical protein